MALLPAYLFVVPLPDVLGDGLADGAEDAQNRLLGVDVVVACAVEEAESGGRHVELGDVVLGDHVPVAREAGVGGCALEDEGGDVQQQRRVDAPTWAV